MTIRIILTLLISVCLNSAYSQELKKYDGDFEQGTATYTYFENDVSEQVLQGDFIYKHNDNSISITEKGAYDHGMKDGLWTITAIENSKLLYQNTINYKKGKLDGDFSYFKNSIINVQDSAKGGKYVVRKEITIDATYKENVQVGNYKYSFNNINEENKGTTLIYSLNDEGLLDGKLEYKKEEYVRMTFFDNGYLKSDLYINQSNGEVLSSIDQSDLIEELTSTYDDSLKGTFISKINFKRGTQPIVSEIIEINDHFKTDKQKEVILSYADSLINDTFYYSDIIIGDTLTDIDSYTMLDSFRDEMKSISLLSNKENGIKKYLGYAKGCDYDSQYSFKVPSISVKVNTHFKSYKKQGTVEMLGSALMGSISMDTVYYASFSGDHLQIIDKRERFFIKNKKALVKLQLDALDIVNEYLKGAEIKYLDEGQLNYFIAELLKIKTDDAISFEVYKSFYTKVLLTIEYESSASRATKFEKTLVKDNILGPKELFIITTDDDLLDTEYRKKYIVFINSLQAVEKGDNAYDKVDSSKFNTKSVYSMVTYNKDRFVKALGYYSFAKSNGGIDSQALINYIDSRIEKCNSYDATFVELNTVYEKIQESCKDHKFNNLQTKYFEVYGYLLSDFDKSELQKNIDILKMVNNNLVHKDAQINSILKLKLSDNAKKINRYIKKSKDAEDSIRIILKYGNNY